MALLEGEEALRETGLTEHMLIIAIEEKEKEERLGKFSLSAVS